MPLITGAHLLRNFFGGPSFSPNPPTVISESQYIQLDRRTVSRQSTCPALRWKVNAVKLIPAPPASKIHQPSSSSKTASGYWLALHARYGIRPIAAGACGFVRAETENHAVLIAAANRGMEVLGGRRHARATARTQLVQTRGFHPPHHHNQSRRRHQVRYRRETAPGPVRWSHLRGAPCLGEDQAFSMPNLAPRKGYSAHPPNHRASDLVGFANSRIQVYCNQGDVHERRP